MPIKPQRNPGREVALMMAEMSASQGYYGEALDWLEVSGEQGSLPLEYEAKRRRWIRQARAFPGTTPRSHRRRTTVEVPHHD